MKSNKGFSFVAVVVVMVVILFLTVSCLAIVNNTYKMKRIETKTDSSFYSAEEEMEQVKADIVLVCKESAEKAYVAILSNLENIPETQYEDYYAVEFKDAFLDSYKKKLTEKEVNATTNDIIIENTATNFCYSYDNTTVTLPNEITLADITYKKDEDNQTVKVDIKGNDDITTEKEVNATTNDIIIENTATNFCYSYDNTTVTLPNEITLADITYKKDEDNQTVKVDIKGNDDITTEVEVPASITLKDVQVEKIDENGYKKTVLTDLVVTPPDFFNRIPISDNKIDYQDFVFVSDDCIEFSGIKTIVNGSTYASGHSSDDLKNLRLVGDGYIFNNGADVTFNGMHYLLSRSNFTLKGNTKVNIANTNMYVKNINLNSYAAKKGASTLSINGNINVEQTMNLDLANSKVTLSGNYVGYTESNDSNTISSSIVINEPYTEVDMTKLTNLTLGGLTYVDEQGKFGSSLDAKFMQTMYLVPSECIVDKATGKHVENPVPKDKDVDIILSSYKKIKLDDYCSGYYEVSSSDKTAFYYFLKFKDDDSAREYATKYLHKNDALMQYKADSFRYGNVLLSNNTLIKAKGILVGYENENLVISNTNVVNSNGLFAENDLIRKKATNLLGSLTESKDVDTLPVNIFSAIFKELQPNTTNNIATVLYEDDDCDGKGYKVVIVDGDYTVSGSFKGLVIATGKVTITDNARVIGNIFAGKEIKCGNNIIAASSENGVFPFVYLTQNYTKKNEIIKYFNGINVVENTDNNSADVEDNVQYDNWQTK